MTGDFFRRRILVPILDLLRQGITPEKIALSIALGITLGAVPVLGSTSVLCLLAALLFRLNIAAIQLVNYLVYPLQFVLFIPFLRAGAWIFSASPMDLSAAIVVSLIRADPWRAITVLWAATLHALVAWFAIGWLASLLLYFLLVPVVRRLGRSLQAETT